MAAIEDKVNTLEIKFATTAQQFISLHDMSQRQHEDNKRLLVEVAKLNDKVSTMNNEFSRGKGIIIGMCIFVGSVFTIINQYFNR